MLKVKPMQRKQSQESRATSVCSVTVCESPAHSARETMAFLRDKGSVSLLLIVFGRVLHSLESPCTSDPSASAYRVLGMQACMQAMPSSYSAKSQSQRLVRARQLSCYFYFLKPVINWETILPEMS